MLLFVLSSYTNIHTLTLAQGMTSRRLSIELCSPTSQRPKVTFGSVRERQCSSTGLMKMAGGSDLLAVLRDGSLGPMSR